MPLKSQIDYSNVLKALKRPESRNSSPKQKWMLGRYGQFREQHPLFESSTLMTLRSARARTEIYFCQGYDPDDHPTLFLKFRRTTGPRIPSPSEHSFEFEPLLLGFWIGTCAPASSHYNYMQVSFPLQIKYSNFTFFKARHSLKFIGGASMIFMHSPQLSMTRIRAQWVQYRTTLSYRYCHQYNMFS